MLNCSCKKQAFDYMPALLRHINKADVRYAKLYYAQRKGGKSVVALSKELGLSEPKVSYMLDKLGLKRKPKVWSNDEVTFIRDNNDRLSTQELADALGVEPKQINAKRSH